MFSTFTKRSMLATTIIAGLAFAGPAYGQSPTPPETEADQTEPTTQETVVDTSAEGQPVEEPTDIVVTGSRIRRPNLENAVPTLVVGEEVFDATNATNFADVANTLPQFTPSFGASRTQSTFSGAATSGLQLVNLRNLGGIRTLTLINGRRMPGGTTTSTSVDFNTIPSANIDRVEVITGGASAIYGADAVAGVVNIITRSSFVGAEVGASYRIAQRGDDATPQAYAIFGAEIGDGGHAVVTAEVTKQGEVICRDRFICAEDFFWNGVAAPIRGPAAQSGVGLTGRFFTPSGASFTRAGEPFNVSIHGFNRNAVRTLAQDTERFMIQGEASYPIYDWLEPFVELNYGLANTQAAFEGHPFQSQAAGSLFGGGPGVAGLQASIPITNPFIPDWLRTLVLTQNPAATAITWWDRFQSLNPRGATNERQMFRAVAGIRGEFDLGLAGPWSYEAHYVHGQTTLNSLTRGLVSTRNLYYGLRVEPDPAIPGGFRCVDAGARASGCIPINPFDGYDAAERAALNVDAGQGGKGMIRDFQAYVTGDLFALPGGNLSVATGVESRSHSGFLDYDEPINNATVTGNQIGDTDLVRRNTKDWYIEGIAPVFGGQPWLNNLTLEGAYRISDPSVGDHYSTWRYGGSAEFIPGLKARVMRARAVREPTPGELSGIGQSFGVINDPCFVENRNLNATRAANCIADGVPADYNPPLVVRQGTGGFVGGNPELGPERGTTLTYGIAFSPTRDGPLGFLNGLSLTADRFEIAMEDVVSTVGRQTKVDLCYDTTERLFCEDIVRAAHPLLAGPFFLRDVNDQLINLATIDVSGYDFEARYGFGLPILSSTGRVSLQAVVTHYDKAKQVILPGSDPQDLLGSAGGDTTTQGYIKWTGVGNVGYRQGGTSLNWNIRYIGKAKTAYFAPENFPTIGDRWYHNVRLSQRVGERFEMYFGVNNLLDSDPPFFPSGTAGTQALDTIPAYYDVFGREFYTGVRLNF